MTNEMPSKRPKVTGVLSSERKEQLDAYMEKHGCSGSEVVNQALELFLRQDRLIIDVPPVLLEKINSDQSGEAKKKIKMLVALAKAFELSPEVVLSGALEQSLDEKAQP